MRESKGAGILRVATSNTEPGSRKFLSDGEEIIRDRFIINSHHPQNIMKLNIKFKLNKQLDKNMTLIFLGSGEKGGVDFSNSVTFYHPELKNVIDSNKEEKIKFISDYFDKFYKLHRQEFKDLIAKMQSSWKNIEPSFINELNKTFKDPQKPNGKYIGYLSAINCNPRFLKDKTYQIFYGHKAGSSYVTVHEVLHFFFYDYAVKKYPEIFGKLDTNNGIFWDLAELFNAVIMSSKDFMGGKYASITEPYPAHQKYFDKMKEIWNKNPDIDNWLIEAYGYLSKYNS